MFAVYTYKIEVKTSFRTTANFRMSLDAILSNFVWKKLAKIKMSKKLTVSDGSQILNDYL